MQRQGMKLTRIPKDAMITLVCGGSIWFAPDLHASSIPLGSS
jgi:hypothetical protein